MLDLYVYRLPDDYSPVHYKVEDDPKALLAYLTAIGKEYFGEGVELYISYIDREQLYFVRSGTLLGRAVIVRKSR